MKKPATYVFSALLLVLGILLLFKLSTVLNRQFDPDELSYLHWAYLLSRGQLPYRDFFFYVTPLFPGFLSPLFFLPHSQNTAIVARLVLFGVYLMSLNVLFSLVKSQTKNIHIALLSVLLFVAFPMTFDKTIEIRPDMVMTLFFLMGTALLVRNTGTTDQDSPVRPLLSLLVSGVFLSLSFLVMYKIVFAAPALLFLLFLQKNIKRSRAFLWFLGGALLPIAVLFLYLLKNNLVALFFNSVIHDAGIVNVGNSSFPIWMTLSPWPLIYVTGGGWSVPWILNSMIWLLMIPGILFLYKKNKTMGIFLGVLLISAAGFLYLFPKPYVQYFIIPSIIASIGVASLVTGVSKKIEIGAITLMSILLLLSFSMQTRDRAQPMAGNQEQLAVLTDVLSVIKPDEPVYDMVGSFVFRPDGYFICCHPYIQFSHLLKRPLPTLTESLIQTKTKFLVLDQKGYVFWIAKPEDLSFLTTHYLPSAYHKIYTLGSRFQCKGGSCIQLNVHGNAVSGEPTDTLDIVIEERYVLSIAPANQHITINNDQAINKQTIRFSPGLYRFSVPTGVTEFTIQLAR